jgi:hypothetical protein
MIHLIEEIGIAFLLIGAGLVIVGLGVFGYQCSFWLQYGSWAWLGGQWPIVVGWIGVQKNIIWILETALSVSLILIGIFVFVVVLTVCNAVSK